MPAIICSLPRELTEAILRFLPVSDLVQNCALVCRVWCRVARSLKHPLETINLTSFAAIDRLSSQLKDCTVFGANVKSIRISLLRCHGNDHDRGAQLRKILYYCPNVETISVGPMNSESKKLLDAIANNFSAHEQQRPIIASNTEIIDESSNANRITTKKKRESSVDGEQYNRPLLLPHLSKIGVDYHHNKAAQQTYIDLNYLYRTSMQWLRLELDDEGDCIKYLNEHYGGILTYLATLKNLTALHLSVGKDQPLFLMEMLGCLSNLEVLSLNCAALTDDSFMSTSNRVIMQRLKMKQLILSNTTIHILVLPKLREQFPNLEILCVMGTIGHDTNSNSRPISVEEGYTILRRFVQSIAKADMKGLFLQLDFYREHIRVYDRNGTKHFKDFHDSFAGIAG